MKHIATLVLPAILFTSLIQAQTCDLVVFSDDGQKFTLLVDGDQKNATPAARVVATGIRNQTPQCLIRFEDKSIPEMKKPLYLEMGTEYTTMITTNKKGERVLRMSGQNPLGTAASAETATPRPTNFQEDMPAASEETQMVTQSSTVGGMQTTTTTTITEGGNTGENVNLSMGMNGVGINMNVNVNDGMGTSTQTTQTTTTATTHSTVPATAKPVAREEAAYNMPGYTGKVGCPWPMSTSEFESAKQSISSKSFEDTKMTMARQIAGDRCMTVDQVKGIVGLFTFEDNKLDFAKFAYDHTYDLGNYFKVNDAFTFEASVDELNEYIQSR